MAGKYGSASIVITIDSTAGGSPQTITPYVLEIGGIKIEAITEQTNPFGVAFEEHTPVGVVKVGPISIKGKFDTTATVGPHVVFVAPDDGPQDSTRTFTFAPGDSKVFTAEVRLLSYEVLGKNGGLTEYEAMIQPTGTFSWA